jgi:V8-like Glu-specific endopeptidase
MDVNNHNIVDYYYRILQSAQEQPGDALVESLTKNNLDLSVEGIKDKVTQTTYELHRIIKEYLDDKAELHQIVNQVYSNGKDALKALAERDADYLIRNNYAGLLEVIVKTDGSRPSFLIRNGEVDLVSSPVGSWSGYIEVNSDDLKKAIACIGRINLSGIHIGTGFMVAKDLIMTNRHVMQAICTEAAGKWHLKSNATIDFGFEYRGRQSVMPREIIGIAFYTAENIDYQHIDHQKLDVVLLQLSTDNVDKFQRDFFSIDVSSEWANAESASMLYITGYPANPGFPGLAQYGNLLETLFHSTFGYKRLAPGTIIGSTVTTVPWTTAHDATTLGGNSGSPVIRIGREMSVSGIHYGGSVRTPRENWTHILGKCLSAVASTDQKTLEEILNANGVKLIDNY